MLIWTIASNTPFGRRRLYQGVERAIWASLTAGSHERLAAAASVAEDARERERHAHAQPPGTSGGNPRPLAVALDAAARGLPVLRPLDLHGGGPGPLHVDREALPLQGGQHHLGVALRHHDRVRQGDGEQAP